MGPFYPIKRLAEADADLTMLEGHTTRALGDVVAISGRVLDRLLKNLSADQTVSVIRAFSYFSHLANIAEDRHHVRRREHHESQGHLQEGSLAMAFERMADADIRADEIAQMLAQAGRVGSHLRDNEWLMAIKQRTAIPGGVCEFDLPAYHWWLNQDPGPRRNDLVVNAHGSQFSGHPRSRLPGKNKRTEPRFIVFGY